MSLAIGVCCKDQLVIASSDSKVSSWPLDKPGYPVDLIEETDMKAEKVQKITDKVLLCATGFNVLIDLFKRELLERVKPEFDLAESVECFNQLLADLQAGEVKGLTERELNLLSLEETLHCCLMGFLPNGVTGVANYNHPDEKVEVFESPMEERQGYPLFIMAPDPDNDLRFLQVLSLPDEEQTFSNFRDRFLVTHAFLSNDHKKVISTDCNFHVLYKDAVDGEIKHEYFSQDTAELYEAFGLNE